MTTAKENNRGLQNILDGVKVDIDIVGKIKLDFTIDQETWDKLKISDKHLVLEAVKLLGDKN